MGDAWTGNTPPLNAARSSGPRTAVRVHASHRRHGACRAAFRCAAFSGYAALRGTRRAGYVRPSLAVFVERLASPEHARHRASRLPASAVLTQQCSSRRSAWAIQLPTRCAGRFASRCCQVRASCAHQAARPRACCPRRSPTQAACRLSASSRPPSPFAAMVCASDQRRGGGSRGFGDPPDITRDYAQASCLFVRGMRHPCRTQARARVIRRYVSVPLSASCAAQGAPLLRRGGRRPARTSASARHPWLAAPDQATRCAWRERSRFAASSGLGSARRTPRQGPGTSCRPLRPGHRHAPVNREANKALIGVVDAHVATRCPRVVHNRPSGRPAQRVAHPQPVAPGSVVDNGWSAPCQTRHAP